MAKKNSPEYWEKRIAENIWDTYNNAEEKNRILMEFYQDASKRIRDELYGLAEKLSRNGILSLSDTYKYDRLTKLKKRYQDIVKELGEKTEEAAKKTMQDGFKQVYGTVCEGLGDIDYAIPNKKLMEEMMERPWRGGDFSGRLWADQKKLASGLNDLLLTGLQQGKTVTEIAVGLNNLMGRGFNAAHRLVRTEMMHYLNVAAVRGYKDLGIDKVQYWAALDERTCDRCGVNGYHGKIYPIDKAPVLPIHPNCRCTYLPVIGDPPMMVGGVECTVIKKKYGFDDGKGGIFKESDADIYTTPDGTKFVFPSGLDASKQTMTPDEAIGLWEKVPEELRKKAQKTIEFVDYYNPQDSYWQKVYKNFTQSYATGGEKITFYRYEYPHDKDYVVRTYCHEAGHYIDRNLGTKVARFSSDKMWTDAMERDIIISKKKSPTEYGENAETEDFAESIAEYLEDEHYFTENFPNRAAILKAILYG